MQKNKSTQISSENGFDYKRYIRLIKRKKWLILTIFSVVFVLWTVLAVKFGPRPFYKTNALLQFEDRRSISALEARGRQENEAKVGLLMSRSFLGSVVDKLALEVKFPRNDRIGVVDSIMVKSGFLEGKYVLQNKNGQLQLFYTSKDKTIEDKQVLDIPYLENNVLEYDGIRFVLKKDFWDTHNKVVFNVRSRGNAIESLRASLKPSWMNRARTLLKIEITGQDRFLITDIMNTLVDEFVQKNLELKKYHTREVLGILTEQLKTAQEGLDKAEKKLRQFRERNPWVGLTPDANGIVNGMSTAEAERANVSTQKSQLQVLLSRLSSATGENRYSVLHELLSFLNAQGNPTIPALLSEYTSLTTERSRLLANYAPTHEVVVENARKLRALEQKVLDNANSQLQQYNTRLAGIASRIKNDNYKIRNLPAKELQLAELQRKRLAAEQVYSSLLERFNQAKVADAVEVGDILVLDKAVVPPSGGRFKRYLQYAIIGALLGLVLGLGIVVIGNFLDKTVRTSDELERIIPIRVLAKIPIIATEKDIIEEDFDGPPRVDPKLVTADYSPTPVGEAYRTLRTQLLFNNAKTKSIFITSLNPNEGKSLNAGNLAITFAQQKLPTIIVDADLRRGVLHNTFASKKKPGLTDFLYSQADVTDENLRKIIQQTHIPNLYLLSSGMPVPNPSEVLGTPRAKELFEFLKTRFGFMIIDTPPITVTSDSVVISRYVDGGLFVVRAGKSNVEKIKDKIDEFEDFSDRLLGIVLNFAKHEFEKDRYHYSYYNY